MWVFLGSVSMLAVLGFLIAAIFWKGRRIRMLKASAASFVVMAVLAILSNRADHTARETAVAAGFASPAEHQAAKAAGFETRAEQDAAAEAALAEKEAAEEVARKAALEKELAEKAAAEEAAAKAEAEAAACRTDLQCWADKHSAAAEVRCPKVIETLAKYDFEWTDSWAEMKFSHFRWKDTNEGHITYLGDKLKLQNGFGAWARYTYWCDFDPQTKTVIDAGAEQGRL